MLFNKKLFFNVFSLLFFMSLPLTNLAQGDPCADPDLPCSPVNNNCNCPGCLNNTSGTPPCPVDGGVSLLIAAGLGLGAKRVYRYRRQA
jgi:hypothetical protein